MRKKFGCELEDHGEPKRKLQEKIVRSNLSFFRMFLFPVTQKEYNDAYLDCTFLACNSMHLRNF